MAVQPIRIVITGATASGKSGLALALSERIDAEILSVDSMQVYRGMDIGTAKPTADEQRRVRHHLIDLVEPDEPYTVARFVEAADAVIADTTARNRPLILVGGTPLYYKALFEGLFDGPSSDAAFRAELEHQPLDQLYQRLSEVDPPAATRIHPNDRRRITRALEVFHLTGRPISQQQTEWSSGQLRHTARWFGLNWPREQLSNRINQRVRQMIAAGWVDEVDRLRKQFPTFSQTAGEATGYAHLLAHLAGRLSLDNAIEQIKIDTRQLSRRQIKWFRRWSQIQPLDGSRLLEALVQEILHGCEIP